MHNHHAISSISFLRKPIGDISLSDDTVLNIIYKAIQSENFQRFVGSWIIHDLQIYQYPTDVICKVEPNFKVITRPYYVNVSVLIKFAQKTSVLTFNNYHKFSIKSYVLDVY